MTKLLLSFILSQILSSKNMTSFLQDDTLVVVSVLVFVTGRDGHLNAIKEFSAALVFVN